MSKVCIKCKSKASEFSRKYPKWCIDCARIRSRKYVNDFYARNKETKQGWNSKYYRENRIKQRALTYQSTGMPIAEIILLVKKITKCEICGRSEVETKCSLHIDHCHKLNQIRGILCRDCNLGIGRFEDDPIRLQKAIQYLAKKIPSKLAS